MWDDAELRNREEDGCGLMQRKTQSLEDGGGCGWADAQFRLGPGQQCSGSSDRNPVLSGSGYRSSLDSDPGLWKT